MRRSLLGWFGGAAAVAIVVASLVVRSGGPADPAADVGDQRAAVSSFHDLVRAGRWDEVFRRTTEPPGRDPQAFAQLMRKRVREDGKITEIRVDEMRLVRARPAPMLEVRETLILSKDGREQQRRTVSFFARRGERWLFAFSSPAK